MKSHLLFFALLFSFSGLLTHAQDCSQDTSGYNYAYWNALADKKQLGPAERKEFIEGCKQLYHREKAEGHLHLKESELVWVQETPGKGYSQSATNAGPCTNMDFETGNFTGWTRSNGFNPLFNATGCCPTANGDQTIMTGAGVDPYGGFPVVYPGGGAFSLRLGSTAIGGRADRIEQTFFVTPANANFTYRYAVVLNASGHTLVQQPRFTIEMIDTLGNQIPCTFYNVSAGTNLAGYFTSSLQANGNGVVYKPWTSVAIDLTPNIGQNVTLRYTVYDCSPSGHFAYAYIDGFCSNFQTSVSDTTCPNIPYNMCGPDGFGQYIWNGPGVVNNTNQCINVSAPGIYTCQTILVPGCPGPSFFHTLTLRPNPVLSFTPSTGICSPQFSFASTGSISAGSIASYTFTFGDNTGTPLQNPIHTYPGPGAYNVKLKAFSDRGCRDSIQQTVFVYPNPVIAFSPPSHCINTLVQFTNTSSVPPVANVPAGSVVSYSWNLGNGVTSNAQNPSTTYTNSGTYTVTLSVTSDQGCTTTGSQTLGIHPPPVLDFTANPLCDLNGTSFAPSTATSIISGSIVSYFWNFGDGSTSNQQSPIHIYNTPGIYTITYIGTSNHSCVDSISRTLTISPTPTIAFGTTSVNACTPSFTFNNNSSILAPGTISYSWNFGGVGTSTLASPQFTFPGIGSYTVRLIGTSDMGCRDTAYHAITIYPLPVVTVSVPASCENAIFTVSTTAVSGSVTSYNWDFGDPASGSANTSTLQNPTHSYNNVGNYLITLQILSNLNCPTSFTSQIFVRPNPVASFTLFPPDACTTTFSLVNNSGFNPTPPPSGNNIASYLWDFNGLGTSTLTTPVFNFPGPGTYSISLLATTNHNCRDTTVANITIHPYPQASLTVLPSCLNVPAQYTGSFSIAQLPFPGSVNSFSWNFGDGVLDNTNLNPLHNYVNPGTYTVSFSAVSNMGCITTRTTNLVIHPVPQVNFNLNNVCAGSAITFSNLTTIISGNVSSYAWDFEDDGITNTNLPSPVYTYTLPGQYDVELLARSNFNCVDSVKKTLTVYDVPVPVISAENVCANLATPFSASLSTAGQGAQITAYNWMLGDGSPFVQVSAGSHVYAQPGSYVMQLTTTNNFNCIRTTTAAVTVFNIPDVNFISNPVCLNSPTSFTNLTTLAAPDVVDRWRWDFGNGWVRTAGRDTAIMFPLPGSFLVKLEAISSNFCSASKTATVVVRNNPFAEFTTSLVCVGDKLGFKNLSTSSDGTIVSNAWDFNGDGLFDLNAPVPDFSYGTPGLYNVKLEVTTAYGCISSKTQAIHANPKAIPSFSSDVASGCPELCVTFSNNSSISSGTFTSRWDFGDNSSTSAIYNPKHCYNQGSFDVKLELRSDSGCRSSLINQGFINVHPNPVANFFVTPEMVDEDEPNISVYNSSSSDANGFKYYVNDGTSFGTANFNHTIKNLQKKVKPMIVQIVSNRFGCVDTLYKVLEIKPAFAIYVPNVFTPNGDNRNDGFQAKGVGIAKFAMQVYDRWGHLVWSTNDINESWDGNVRGVSNTKKQDVFTWKAQVVDILNETHDLVGHVTLLQ